MYAYNGFTGSGGLSLDDVLSGIPTNATNISLRNNSISQLYRSSFADRHFVQHLDLSFNRITHIPQNCFERMPSLIELFLKSNKILIVVHTSLGGLNKLRHLDLRRNRLLTIPLGFFDPTTSLTTLNLERNQFQGMISVFFSLTHSQMRIS